MEVSPLHSRLKQKRFESEIQQAMLSILVAADIIKRKQLSVCVSRDLTHSQYNILRILRGNPDGYSRKEIIERMLEKAPDATRLIDGLVAQGMAERITSKVDKRVSLTRITEKGKKTLIALHEPMQTFSKELDALYNKTELTKLADLCGRIIAHEMKEKESN